MNFRNVSEGTLPGYQTDFSRRDCLKSGVLDVLPQKGFNNLVGFGPRKQQVSATICRRQKRKGVGSRFLKKCKRRAKSVAPGGRKTWRRAKKWSRLRVASCGGTELVDAQTARLAIGKTLLPVEINIEPWSGPTRFRHHLPPLAAENENPQPTNVSKYGFSGRLREARI